MKPDNDGNLAEITPEQLMVLAHNIQDVALLVGVHTIVKSCGEPDVIRADAAANERGVGFDCELAMKLIGLERPPRSRCTSLWKKPLAALSNAQT